MIYKTFQFCYCNVSLTLKARKHRAVNVYTSDNLKILKNMFGFSRMELCKLLAETNRAFRKKEPGELIESYNFFKKIGYSKEDLLNYPSLLAAHPVMKINHYNSLQDTGCKPIDPELLSGATSYFLGKVIVFKNHGYLGEDDNVAERLLSQLDPPIELPGGLSKEIEELDEMRWTEIHRILLVDWLKKRLDATDDDLIKLLRIHKMIKNKSFRTINENITLAESLGLTNEKILKCGYLLNNHPEYPKTMLRDHPFFAGIDIAKAYKCNPKMMMVNPRRIMEIYKILKEYNVPDQLIQNKPDVFTVSPITVRERLDEIQTTPEFRVLYSDPNMLKLVVHHNKIKSRLSFLKSLKLRCASLNYLGSLGGPTFENYIQQGKDMNRPTWTVHFFCRLLDKERAYVEKKLQRHPYYYYVPFVDIDNTFQYLLQIGYTKANVARCLLILLYPRVKISEALTRLHADQSLHFREQSQCKQLSLILYCIEKDHHFTGKGIWAMYNSDTDGIIEERTLE